MICTPVSAKSRVSRVASDMLRARVIAAICASESLIGRPRRRLSMTIAANSRAARLSNGRMRPANSVEDALRGGSEIALAPALRQDRDAVDDFRFRHCGREQS